MPLSPEEIEGQRFRDSLRGYDKAQVDDLLAAVASSYRAALNDDRDAEEGGEGALTIDDITHFHFDDALRGYDKEDVRQFLERVTTDMRALARPGSHGGHEAGGAPTPEGDDAAKDVDVIVRSARDLAGAIRAGAERDASEMRALAAEEAAKAVEAAWEETNRAKAARALAQEELAAASSIRTGAEREMAALRAEAANVATMAVEELERGRFLQDEAKAAAAAAAAELSAAAGLRAEAERLVDEARQAAAELVDGAVGDAAGLREEARRQLAAAEDELDLAQALGREAKQEAAEIREAAAAEHRAGAERDAAAVREAADRHARHVVARARAHLDETASLLAELAQQLDGLRDEGSHQMAEAVRRLEDQVLAAVGGVQDELQQSAYRALAQVRAAEERVRDMAQRLADADPEPARPEGDAEEPAGDLR